MANLNRIKLVLVEKNKTGKWLADELGKTPSTYSTWRDRKSTRLNSSH